MLVPVNTTDSVMLAVSSSGSFSLSALDTDWESGSMWRLVSGMGTVLNAGTLLGHWMAGDRFDSVAAGVSAVADVVPVLLLSAGG